MSDYLKAMVYVITGGRGRDERGATAVEYGIMVALIAVVIIGAVALIGTNLNTVFGDVAASLGPVAP